MKKKLFSLVLSLAICLSAFAYDFEVDGLYYNIINDGEVEVTSGDASYPDSVVVIPSSVTHNGTIYSVTYVWEEAFAGCSGMAALTCNTATPPTIQSNSFSNYNATLYVPDNSVALYQAADYWKNFNIMPLSRTQLDYTLEEKNVIYCNQIVYNENGLDITLFDASGRMSSSGNGNIDMSCCPNGIYIVADGKDGILKINHCRWLSGYILNAFP